MIRNGLQATLGILSFLLLIAPLQAQKNGERTVLKIGKDKVSKSEFKTIYFKNNKDSVVTEESLMDYMELFIDFKLKVKEAEKMGLDTTRKFKNEFERYKDQLARPYLIDSATRKELLREAYERTKEQVHASHILVRLQKENPLPEDTAEAYERIMKIKERVKESDSSFLDVGKALEKKKKDVRSSDLGYFGAFRMVYPFEDAAFKTEMGSIGGPVRTQYGYHLIKVHDKRASKGKIKVAHIMKHAPKKMSPQKRKKAKEEIDSLYKRLQKGADLHDLARQHSDDRRSKRKGGRLPWFKFGEMLPSFSEAAFALDSNGAVSKPVRTRHGWHIIKRLDLKELSEFEEMKPELEKKMKDSDRSSKVREAVLERLKDEYDLKVEKGRLENFVQALPDSSFIPQDWVEDASGLASRDLLSFADTSVKVKELAYQVGRKRNISDERSAKEQMAKEKLDALIKEAIFSYEKEQLKEKHPRYQALLQEYRDGILLFELMEKKVWNKALEDTVGLEKYYQEHQDQYQWDERADLTYLQCKNEQAAENGKELLQKGGEKKELLKELRNGKNLKCRLDSGSFEKESKIFLQKIEWDKGVTSIVEAKGAYYVGKLHQVIPPGPKKLEEARGLVSSDYQDHLEKRWVEQLRDEYEIEIKKDVLLKIAEEEGSGE